MAGTLEIRGVSLGFGGIRALDGIDLSLAPGETLGLIGPNGSGKSSLLNLISGHYAPDAGTIRFDGQDIAGRPPHAVARLGVARTFQAARVLRRLSVYENVRAARHATAAPWDSLWQSRAARRRERDTLRDLLDRFGLAEKAEAAPETLSLLDLRRLGLARAVAARPSLLLLDEPAGGLTPEDARGLTRLIGSEVLPGRTAILVEHRLDVLTPLCARLAVLQTGHKIADGPTRAVLADPRVREIYLGEAA